jgi:phage regulator Rha-like protein
MKKTPVPQPVGLDITPLIFTVRGQKVMMDSDLAILYEVETKALIRAVKRNLERFPSDFMFQLTKEEHVSLRYHFGTSKGRGGRRYLPLVFTEHGVAMLSSVLRSHKAIQVNIAVMRAFSRLRHVLVSQEKITEKLEELEKIVRIHDKQIQGVFEALRQLIEPPAPKQRQIGFTVEDKNK